MLTNRPTSCQRARVLVAILPATLVVGMMVLGVGCTRDGDSSPPQASTNKQPAQDHHGLEVETATSPDGKWMATIRTGGDVGSEFELAGPSGLHAVERDAEGLGFSLDSTLFLYVSYVAPGRSLFVIDLNDDATRRQVTNISLPPPPTGQPFHPDFTFSPTAGVPIEWDGHVIEYTFPDIGRYRIDLDTGDVLERPK